MKTKKNILILMLLLILAPGASLFANAAQQGSKILVLYKERDPDHSALVNYFTQFLKRAGYKWDEKNVETLLKEKPDVSPYSGIMTCFQTSQMIGADIYPHWLVQQMEAGRRILIIGSYGAYQGVIKKSDGTFVEWNESTQTINTFFYPFGLEFYFAFTDDNSKLRITKKIKEYAEYEARVSQRDLYYYQLYKSVNPENKIYFELERTDMIESRSALNVQTPYGGMILEGYAHFWDSRKKRNINRVNFTKFMREVFSAKSPPVPKLNIQTHDKLVKKYPLPQRKPPAKFMSAAASEASRQILILYKKSEAPILEDLPFYNRGDVVLEYLGVIPIYWPVEDGLPDDNMMKSVKGILTWHVSPYMVNAEKYGNWMLRQIRKGKRVCILQEYGASIDLKTQKPAANEKAVFEALGISFTRRGEPREEYLPAVKKLDRKMLSFEGEFDPSIVHYKDTYAAVDPKSKIYLSYTDREYGTVDMVIVTPKGGICMGEAAFCFPPNDAKRIARVRQALAGKLQPEIAEQPTLGHWLIDPYRYFSQSLDLDALPAPDITTLNGSRIFYSHIDGDALESISLIDHAHLAGKFVMEEILKKYSDIPISASIISKFIERYGNDYYNPTVTLAQEIFRLPNIECAVHGALHPFDWIGGDPYIVNPGEYPYKVGYKPHDFIQEIWAAKLFVDHNLAPPGKVCKLFLWTGATNPDEKALAVCWRAGMHNLNGGDPRFDSEYPSLAGLCPYSIPYAPYRQYLTSAQNDYIYSLFLTGDWGGQKKLVAHFAKTDKPYRVYPMNLYYHFYAGIKHESLDAVRFIYDTVRSIDAAPIFTSQYCEIIEDFYNTHLSRDGNAWLIENNGCLRTVRFKKTVQVDMKKSRGVLGYRHYRNQTYIHLDGSRKRRIVLSSSAPDSPFFIQATLFIDEMMIHENSMFFTLRGFGKTFLKIGGLEKNAKYYLSMTCEKREPIAAELMSDAQGIISYRSLIPAPVAIYKASLTRTRGAN